MKIYIVNYFCFYEFYETEKAFTSREKAEKYVEENGDYKLNEIVELEVEE